MSGGVSVAGEEDAVLCLRKFGSGGRAAGRTSIRSIAIALPGSNSALTLATAEPISASMNKCI